MGAACRGSRTSPQFFARYAASLQAHCGMRWSTTSKRKMVFRECL